jgi:hypothetical protein
MEVKELNGETHSRRKLPFELLFTLHGATDVQIFRFVADNCKLLAMICPQCKAEYRRGFTVCRDCEVPLVESPQLLEGDSVNGEPPAAPGDPLKDPFCSFWKGTDLRVCTEICTVLDEAGIPHKTIRRQDHLFNLNNQSPYQVGVPASLYAKAELAIKDAFGTDEEGTEGGKYELDRTKLLPDAADHVSKAGIFSPLLDIAKSQAREFMRDLKALEEGEERESEAATDTEAEPVRGSGTGLNRQYPEDATALIWQGDTADMREMIAMSLQENDIFTRCEEKDGTAEVYVLPEDEERAKEIVREIQEGQPPD